MIVGRTAFIPGPEGAGGGSSYRIPERTIWSHRGTEWSPNRNGGFRIRMQPTCSTGAERGPEE